MATRAGTSIRRAPSRAKPPPPTSRATASTPGSRSSLRRAELFGEHVDHHARRDAVVLGIDGGDGVTGHVGVGGRVTRDVLLGDAGRREARRAKRLVIGGA